MQNQTPSSVKPEALKRTKRSLSKYKAWNDTLRLSNQKLQSTSQDLAHKYQELEREYQLLGKELEAERARPKEELQRHVQRMEHQLNAQLVIRAELEGQILAYKSLVDRLLKGAWDEQEQPEKKRGD